MAETCIHAVCMLATVTIVDQTLIVIAAGVSVAVKSVETVTFESLTRINTGCAVVAAVHALKKVEMCSLLNFQQLLEMLSLHTIQTFIRTTI